MYFFDLTDWCKGPQSAFVPYFPFFLIWSLFSQNLIVPRIEIRTTWAIQPYANPIHPKTKHPRLLLSGVDPVRTPTGRSWHGPFRSWSFDLYRWGQGCRMEEALRMCSDVTWRDITSLRIVTTKKLTSVQFFPNGLPTRSVHVNLLVWELITDLWSYMLSNTLLYPRRHKNLCISVVLPIDLPISLNKRSPFKDQNQVV